MKKLILILAVLTASVAHAQNVRTSQLRDGAGGNVPNLTLTTTGCWNTTAGVVIFSPTCGGGGGSLLLQTLGTNNGSQSTLNFVASSTNVTGLTTSPTNSVQNEAIEILGSITHAHIAATGVGSVSCTSCNLSIQADGSVTSAANGSGGSGVTISTNGVNNTSQTALNAQNSTANTAGLALAFTNPSSGNLKAEISGNLAHASLPTLVSGDIPNNAANTSGSAASLSAASTLPNNTLATTQSCADGTTKLATDAFVTGCSLTNPMTTLGDTIYGGASGTATRLAGAATNGVWYETENVSASTPVAPTRTLAGVVTNAQTGTSYTIGATYTDRGGFITFSNASAIAETVNSAASYGSFIAWRQCNLGAGLLTATPATSTLTILDGSANVVTGATSVAFSKGQCATWLSDNTNYTVILTGPTYPFATLTDSATVTWATASEPFASAVLTFTTHGGSRTLNPTGLVDAGNYQAVFIQDATGGENLTLSTSGSCTSWRKPGGGGAVTSQALTGTAAAQDVMAFTYKASTGVCYFTMGLNY